MSATLRLADLLSGLSMVADLGFGLPPQEAMRASVVATAFARHLDLPETRVRDAFYAALLMHIGCLAVSHEGSRAFGDEIRLTRAVSTVNISSPKAVFSLIPELTRDLSPVARATTAAFTITRGAAWGRATDRGSCEIARETARRLGLSSGTQRALDDIYEWWNGGGPQGLGGDDIDIVARIVMVAGDAAYFDDLGGPGLAVKLLRERVGVLDPDLVERFAQHAEAFLAEVAQDDPRDRLLAVEPEPVIQRPPADVLEVAAIFGDAGDLKTPIFHGHAARVDALVEGAAATLGMDDATTRQARVAALLHDIGRAGVSNKIWEKPGGLTTAEWEQVRVHAYHSERILSASTALAPAARIAGMHHERLDGTGYHRGAFAPELPMAARVLAAADTFAAMTADRPHRPALRPEQAATTLTQAVDRGAYDGEAVAAVLAAAGHAPSRRAARPAGLSSREVEVLRLVARGLTNRQVAARLHISRRTAEHHIQHIYAKIGVSTRAGAALFGLEQGLLADQVGDPSSK